MKTITLDEYLALLKAQGVPRIHLAFKCPMCGTIQSMADLMKLFKVEPTPENEDNAEKYIAFSCIGRWTHGKPPPKKKGTQKGCNWTLGGLFKTHTLEVVTPDGEHHPRFEPCTAKEAKAHMKKCNTKSS